MSDSYDFYLNKLNRIFENTFMEAYKNIKGKNKHNIYKYTSDIFRKWYFSTLMDGTALSPAIIIDKLKRVYNIEPMVFDNIYMAGDLKHPDFLYYRTNYSSESYPVIDDLKYFLKSCDPYIELNPAGDVSDNAKPDIISGLSIKNDNYYINYLASISLELGLIEPVTSIYLKAVKPTKKAKDFFKKDNHKIYLKIVEATITGFANFLEYTMLSSDTTKDFVLSILKQPITIDEIYKRLYLSNGIDLTAIYDEALQNEASFPSDVKEYISLGIYYLGVGIDKYFLTTFGYYLKLITPLYVVPVNMLEDMAILYNAIRENLEIDSEVYSPCSHYFLTPLGKEIFLNSDEQAPYEEFVANDQNDIKDIINSLYKESSKTVKRTHSSVAKTLPEYKVTVYRLKLSFISDKRFWITIEIPEDTTLAELHSQICYAFDFLAISEYSFYVGLEETPFKQYTPEYNKMRTKKTETVSIADLNLEPGDVLKYVINNNSSIFSGIFKNNPVRFELQLVKIKPDEYSPLYPRIYKKSKKFAEYVENLDLNF